MKKFYLFLLAPAISFIACNRSVYVPNQVNVPLLKEKGEVKASVSLSDWQVAYAITDNFAVMTNGQYVSRLVRFEDDDDFDDPIVDPNTRGGLFEVGAGYTKALGISKKPCLKYMADMDSEGLKPMKNRI